MIVCFSGTGNSLRVARDLAAGLGEPAPVSVPRWERERQEGREADRLVLVFPVYSFGPPRMLMEAIRRQDRVRARQVYAVATAGGTPGGALAILDRRLRERGAVVRAGWVLTEWDKWFGRVDGRIRQIVQDIRDERAASLPGSNLLFDAVSPLLHQGFCRRVGGYGKRFRVTADCTRCGLCARLCPAGNITQAAGERPVWGDRCEACFACYAWCPAHAIEFGWAKRLVPVFTAPGVGAQDLVDLKNR